MAALPTSGIGVRLFGVSEDGHLLREPDVLEVMEPSVPDRVSRVYCPRSGPLVMSPTTDGEGYRLLPLRRDGGVDGTFVDLPAFLAARNGTEPACAEAGDEVACITRAGTEPPRIAFVARDGGVRFSAALPEPVAGGGGRDCDLVSLGDGLAILWAVADGDGCAIAYARTDADGVVTRGPVLTERRVGEGPLNFLAATSGGTVLLVSDGPGAGTGPLMGEAHLLSLEGALLGEPLSVTNAGPPHAWDVLRGMAVFWEGDAYSALWGRSVDGQVAYRRLRVVP